MISDCLMARRNRDAWIPRLVFSSNGQGIALAGRDKAFAHTMAQADIIHADGMPVVMASRMTPHPLPERIATTDFFHDASQRAVKTGLSYYVLGATEEQNVAAVAAMRRLYPQLKIVGRHHGYFDLEESDAICAEIRASGADVLWVGLGKPRQERWSVQNRDKLRGIGWIKTCGGLYAYLVGDSPRAPFWMQQAGLEWLYRAFHDPRRLGWRYLATNPYAAYRLLRYTDRE
jgi:N-acetylglucosaminyldiphosphoundecaprenol N-acetyl-beta-D-mannosaminyltransferase